MPCTVTEQKVILFGKEQSEKTECSLQCLLPRLIDFDCVFYQIEFPLFFLIFLYLFVNVLHFFLQIDRLLTYLQNY